jgi:hypothetical protein
MNERESAPEAAMLNAVPKPKRPARLTLEERFAHGNFTVDEVCELKHRSHSGFYSDRKAGLVEIQKVGRKTIVRGPIARKYIAGEPLR